MGGVGSGRVTSRTRGRSLRAVSARGPRLRLVAALVLVAGVPTTAAAWAFLRNAEQNAVERVDLRLTAALAPAAAELERVAAAQVERARRVASRRDVQQALVDRHAARLRAIAGAGRGLAFDVGDTRIGRVPDLAVTGAVTVLRRSSAGRPAGRVLAFAPADERLRARLAATGGLPAGRLFLRREGTVEPGSPQDVGLDGRTHRGVAAPAVGGLQLVAVSPRSEIEESVDVHRGQVALAVLATLLTVAFAAYAVPPALARDRVARRGLALIGDALAATHDGRALLPVILHAAVEATGAAGGVLLADGTEVARVGDDDRRGEPLRLVVPVDEGGDVELVLHPRAGGFGAEAREIGGWLAAQAGIALENARLHRIAREQAVTDPLTQLANRRRFMDALGVELQRSERFGSPLALVLADLDDFKRINDRHGHEVGDDVLRHTAEVLGTALREVDLPARIGGEEFAILLPETDVSGGERLAERLRAGIARPAVRTPEGEPVTVTASFGVAEHRDGWGPAELLRAADRALYAAKLAGRNRVSAAERDPV